MGKLQLCEGRSSAACRVTRQTDLARGEHITPEELPPNIRTVRGNPNGTISQRAERSEHVVLLAVVLLYNPLR